MAANIRKNGELCVPLQIKIVIRKEVLLLQGIDYTVLEKVTDEYASHVYNALMHQHLEPGTKEAFNGYVANRIMSGECKGYVITPNDNRLRFDNPKIEIQ